MNQGKLGWQSVLVLEPEGICRRLGPKCFQQTKKPKRFLVSAFKEKLAATYSRGVYKTTTIGKTVFDGRVRNGNGSDHSFMATKKV